LLELGGNDISFSTEETKAARLAVTVSLACGINPVISAHIGNAVALHDIGKSQIPTHILNKPGRLSPKEYEIMKSHTTIGAQMLEGLQGDFRAIAKNVCLYHHEFCNGRGYWGVYADNLPLYVQIASICDVYVSLISERPYKSAWTQNDALVYIKDRAGEQFNPMLAGVFIPLVQEGGTA
jgi:putative two-component system response regulator